MGFRETLEFLNGPIGLGVLLDFSEYNFLTTYFFLNGRHQVVNILAYLNLHQTHDTINLKALLFVEDVKGVCFLSGLVHLHIHKNNYKIPKPEFSN